MSEFNFTEQPDWRLEDRFQNLMEAKPNLGGDRLIEVSRELAHIIFELDNRVTNPEPALL